MQGFLMIIGLCVIAGIIVLGVQKLLETQMKDDK